MNDFLEYTLCEWMDKAEAEHGDADALVYADGRALRLSYAQLNAVSRRVARAFMALGIGKGDHVAVWAANTPEWVYTLHACARVGAVLVTVNTNYKVFELEYLLRQSDSKALVFSDGVKGSDYHDILAQLTPGAVPLLRRLIHMPGARKAEGGAIEWDDMLALADNVPPEALAAAERDQHTREVINMQYTSGTTGFPKGVCLTHHNILNNGYFIGECMKLTPADRLCIPVPFFHCFGLVLAQMAAITHFSAMVPVEQYNPLQVMRTVQAERCTALHGVPTMFIFILDHPDFASYDLTSLRTGIMAGSTCPIEVMRRVVEQMHQKEIVITYGQTECSPGMTMSRTDDPLELRVATVGRLLPHAEGKVIDPETGLENPPGVPGEICTRGYHLMKGYYKMPEATAQAIDADGWLHTGDIGVCDKDGYWSITGRLKDMIIRGGENISPREIEELLYTHPDIADSQVVGVPSEKFGEEVCAFVIPRSGASLTEEGVKEFVRAKMSRHKIPSHVFFIDTFPMTASGKIMKYKLRDKAAEALGK
ncbi:MAG: AMP-binding protein [Oscillospiraceae bacterium]|jgi:fatty-acyl-CoA synthase|nr:AMP-binding protein [Oscillospiraceae bacterium]